MTTLETICQQIEELDQKATKGPWKSIHGDSYCAYPSVMRQSGPHFIIYDATEEEGKSIETDARWYGTNADADFIALSRTFAPKAARALTGLKALIDARPHERQCHLLSHYPFGDKARAEWEAKGCNCWKSEVAAILAEFE